MARLAYSLETLRNEVNARWPNRAKQSDGWIGDPAHAATASDHNPNAAGVVCALDITNDPSGPTAQYLFDQIRVHPQADCKYIIANRQIASKQYGWTVRSYTGSDPHTSHIHVSVGVGSDGHSQQPYDDTYSWLIGPLPPPTTVTGDEDVLHLIRGDKTDEWWLTDWITKRYIATPDDAAHIVFSTIANGGKIEQDGSNGPVPYPQAIVDRVPKIQ